MTNDTIERNSATPAPEDEKTKRKTAKNVIAIAEAL